MRDANEYNNIALIGATQNKEKYGNKIMKNLKQKGFNLYPVTPNYNEVEGFTAYSDISKLPEDTDVLVFVVPPKIGLEVTKKAKELGFKELWYQPGAESSDLKEYLEENNLDYSFEKCIMVETNYKQ
ncbi:CoA-binding protein [Geotoga petraea]|jgi:predicted CoA-binding protein|uniref:CoA-binding protein n=1 Tax=Geotoga petraea TaxID=28234 RepID=A0A1G6M773_9BACT|nr:CoA-binding protein [Geotoga petraea]TGG87489.1 CoA-binding protein [Geotoga petraea]SDC51154.1 hypothetical protein SAMN04488588_1251 [Geotoga petraea]